MDLMSHKKYNMHFHVLKNIHLMAVNSHISCLFYLLHSEISVSTLRAAGLELSHSTSVT